MKLSLIPSALAAISIAAAFPAADAAVEETSALAHLVKRTCFESGDNWGAEKKYALDKATEFCKDISGSFSRNQHKYHCYNLSTIKKADLTLRLKSTVPPRSIGFDECYNGMQKEINGCSHGGRTAYLNWEYTADVNAGNCA